MQSVPELGEKGFDIGDEDLVLDAFLLDTLNLGLEHGPAAGHRFLLVELIQQFVQLNGQSFALGGSVFVLALALFDRPAQAAQLRFERRQLLRDRVAVSHRSFGGDLFPFVAGRRQ